MDRIRIGKVLKPQGLKGELKIGCTNAHDYLSITRVYMMGREYLVSNLRANGDELYITMIGIENVEDAQIFRGQNVFALRSEVPLNEGQYFIDDLLGCQVVDEKGTIFGRVKSIDNYGSKDVYTLEYDGKECMFACVEHLLKNVDIKEKKIVVDGDIIRRVMI